MMKTARHKSEATTGRTRSSVAKNARSLLRARLAKVELLLSHRDVDDVQEQTHQMRVASRRADVALRIFRHWIPKDVQRRMQRSLDRIRADAGAVRDLDLLCERWQRLIDPPGSAPADVEWLLRRTEKDRCERRSELGKWLRKPVRLRFHRHSRSLVDCVRWQGDGKPPTVQHWSARILSKMGRDFEEALNDSGTSLKRCHRARIRGRRLRYALEQICDALGTNSEADVCRELTALQENLGLLNDDSTAILYLQAAISDCRDSDLRALLQRRLERLEAVVAEHLVKWNNDCPEYSRQLLAGIRALTICNA